jgi:DNA-binding GntR family transcriptional regulator
VAKETPRHLRLAAEIRARIASGELQPGDKIETVEVLSSQHRLNKTSVRSAFDLLQAEGLIERRRGSGTYVAQRSRLTRRAMGRDMRLPKPPSTSPFARDVTAAGMEPRWDHESAPTIATPAIAERLKIQVGDPVMRTRYRYFADNEPIQLADSFEPLAITGGTPVELPEDGAAIGVVARMDLIGVNPTHYIEEVTDRSASPEEAELLQMDPRGSLSVLAIERTYYAGETPVETCDIVFPARRYRVVYEVQLDPAPAPAGG